ncbi:MAG: guanylate kinase [Dehalococcoidia bacterium]|nr:MAG: guanylate kinase [Dehalococcoidia bacterium]
MKKSEYEDENFSNRGNKPLLLVISGPSGAGKDTVLSKIKERKFPLDFIVTVTTRPRRLKEKNGIDYHFVSEEEFKKMIVTDKLLEHANVYGNWYGVPKKPVKQALDEGRDVILKVDIQGADTIKKILPHAVSIFLATPSMQELTIRLKSRNTESETDLDLRLNTAIEEMKRRYSFDHIVINQQHMIDSVIADIFDIITQEKKRLTSREYNL